MPRTEDSVRLQYETVATSQSDQVLGATGKAGDLLQRLIVTVSTAGATGIASIKDGAGSAIPLVVSGTAVGVYTIELGIKSTAGAWKVTTGAAATAVAVGLFS